MYKVEKWIMEDVVKVLDFINEPISVKKMDKWMSKKIKNERKAKKLAKLIRANYTEVTP